MGDTYNFELIENSTGIFDESIDATYVIHLEGNGRIQHVRDQLAKYKTSRKIYILFNKGYKKCKKPSHIINPPLDLIDAYLTIFKHSVGLGNILILEDDFIFDDKILSPIVYNEINNFVSSRNDSFVYYLGCIPNILMSYLPKHKITLGTLGAHSVIYSSKFRENTLTNNVLGISDWDEFLNSHFDRYMYFEPLCYQPFPETENSKYWGCKSFISTIALYIGFRFLNFMIDSDNPSVGYRFLYEHAITLPNPK